MRINNVLAELAVTEADAEPMPGLTEWHHAGGTVQLVADEQRMARW